MSLAPGVRVTAEAKDRSEPIRRQLVVVESGAAPCLQDETSGAFEQTTVIAQLANEEPAEFADRVLRRLAALERTARGFAPGFAGAVLMTGASDDGETESARRLIALGIAGHAEATGSLAELRVCAPESASAKLRAALFQLADDLVLAAERKPLPVRVSFLEARPLAALRSHPKVEQGEDRDLPARDAQQPGKSQALFLAEAQRAREVDFAHRPAEDLTALLRGRPVA